MHACVLQTHTTHTHTHTQKQVQSHLLSKPPPVCHEGGTKANPPRAGLILLV